MANFYVHVLDDATNMALTPPVQTLKVTPGVSSTATAALAGGNRQPRICRVVADEDVQFVWGAAVPSDPVADADSLFLPAGVVEYVQAEAGQKFAVIQKQA